MSSGLVNPDLAKERHANLDLAKLTKFLGETQFKQPGEYENMLDRRDYFESILIIILFGLILMV